MNFDTTKKNLEALGYAVSTFATAKEALDYLNGQIDGVTVGIGGSMTVEDMRIYPSLASHNEVFCTSIPPRAKRRKR